MRSFIRLVSSRPIISKTPGRFSIHTSGPVHRGLDLLAAYKQTPSSASTAADVAANHKEEHSDVRPEITAGAHHFPSIGNFPLHEPTPPPITVQASFSSGTESLQEGLVEDEGRKQTVKDEGMTVQGVHVPPKPRPPGDEDCCMSGCVHCVYTIYADDLETYTESISAARSALRTAGVDETTWPDVVRHIASDIKDKMVEKVEDGLDPTLAAFFALENRIKTRQSTG